MKKIAKIGLMLFSLSCVSCTLVGKVSGHTFKFKSLYIEGEGDIPKEAYDSQAYEKSTIEFPDKAGFIWGEIEGMVAVGIYNQYDSDIYLSIQKYYRGSEVVAAFEGDDYPQYQATLKGNNITICAGGAGASGTSKDGSRYSYDYKVYIVYSFSK